MLELFFMSETKPKISAAMESKGLLFLYTPIGLKTWYAVGDADLK